MQRNSPGNLAAGVPAFIAQGTADDIVRPAITRRYANNLCRSGTRVELIALEGVSHSFAGEESAYAAVKWMAARFAGEPAPSGCGRI